MPVNPHGIGAREARNTVLLDLAAELAPAFLSELLGMHVNTAVRWGRNAGGDWGAGFAAARARRCSVTTSPAGVTLAAGAALPVAP